MPPRCDDEKWEVQLRINEKVEKQIDAIHDDVLVMKTKRGMESAIVAIIVSAIIGISVNVAGGCIIYWLLKK